MRSHVAWTRAGRTLRWSDTQRAYCAIIGQQNIELDDGSFAPFLWNDDARVLRYADIEARFGRDRVTFLHGYAVATTCPRVQRRTSRGWVDEPTRARIERLSDEDDLEAVASARVAIVLESRNVRARHIVVAGCRSRARADTELVALLPGEYRVVVEHTLAAPRHVENRARSGVLLTESYRSRDGWRVAWTGEEARERDVVAHDNGITIALPSLRRARGQRRPSRQYISPDTYGPVLIADSEDDDDSCSGASNGDYLAFGAGGNTMAVDDDEAAEKCSSWRFLSVDLGGTPLSIDAGTQIRLVRDPGGENWGASGVVRFKCQDSNTPSASSDTSNTTTGRPFHRSYASGFNDTDFPEANTTVDASLVNAIGSLIAAEYSYTGSSTHAILIGAGASALFGITPCARRAVGMHSAHDTGPSGALTIVYSFEAPPPPTILFLTSTATSSPAPTTSYVLLETANSSEAEVNSGEFDNGVPGTTDAGQWSPGDNITSTTVATELDNVSGTTTPIRGTTAPTATDSPTSPAGTEVGDLVIVSMFTRGGNGIPTRTLNSAGGFVEIRTHEHNDGTTDGRLSTAYKIATAPGANSYPAYTSGSGTNRSGILVVKAGAYDPDALATMASSSASATITGTGASDPPAITLPTAGSLVVAITALHQSTAGDNTAGAPTNYTLAYQVAGSADSELALATRLLIGLSGSSEDPGTFSDSVTPNGSCAMTFAVPLLADQATTTRKGWLWNEDLTDRVLSAGTWGAQLRLEATQGSGSSGRLALRVSVVKAVSNAWVTVKNLLQTRITGSDVGGLKIGQMGWRDQQESRHVVTSTPTNFSSTFATGSGHTFAADERIFVELGFCDGDSGTDRTWRLLHNTSNSFLTLPGLTPAEDEDEGEIAGSTAGSSTATATLKGTGRLAGSLAATSTATAALKGAGRVSGSASGTSTADATARAFMAGAGSAAGTSTTTAVIKGAGALAGSASGTSAASAVLKGAGRLAGSAVGTSTAAAAATLLASLSGSTAGSSTATATLKGTGRLAGSAVGLSAAAAMLLGVGALAGSAVGASTASAELKGVGGIAGSSLGSSAATATLKGVGRLAGSAAGTSTAHAKFSVEGDLAGSTAGTSTANATLKGAGRLAGSAAGTSTCTAALKATGRLAGSTAGTCGAFATLKGLGRLFGTAAGSSTVTASLQDWAPTSPWPAGPFTATDLPRAAYAFAEPAIATATGAPEISTAKVEDA